MNSWRARRHREIFSVFFVFVFVVSVRPFPGLPPGFGALPASSEALPGGSESLPAGSEALPAGSEVLIAGSQLIKSPYVVMP